MTKVIKPAVQPGAKRANAIYVHGDAWLQKVRRLRKRNLLPRDIMFALAVPPQSDAKRYGAFGEICTELQAEDDATGLSGTG